MFFESALKGKNGVWRYILMFIVVFIGAANIIGGIPLLIIIVINSLKNPEVVEATSDNLADLSVYGIGSNLGLILMIIPFIAGLIALYLLMKPLHGRAFLTLFNGGGKVRWKRFFFSALVWTAIMILYLWGSMRLDSDNFSLNNLSSSLIWLVLIAIILIPFQTSFEEILFRGYLMQGAGAWFGNKWAPLLLTSLLFGLMHVLNPEIKEWGFWVMMPQYITHGLLFGLIVVLDDGIEIAMGAHAANNVFLSIFLTQESSVLQTAAVFEQHEVYPWQDFIGLLVLSIVFLTIMAITYKWGSGKISGINID